MKTQDIDPSLIQGNLFLIVGPSGSGKSTIIEEILKSNPELHFPVSATTRKPRPGEVPGEDYYYLSIDEFKQKLDEGKFLEFAQVHGHSLYGTLFSEIIDPLRSGQSVIRHIDYQGAKSIRDLLPKENVHVIYINGGTWQQLLTRINSRSELSEAEIERRHQSFLVESQFINEADLVVDNLDNELSIAVSKVNQYINLYLNS